MSTQTADALMGIFGLKRQTVMVYELNRGDKFTVDGWSETWEFRSMDGAYCYAVNDSGQVLNWSGPVTRVDK
jgi:hypothetical protein